MARSGVKSTIRDVDKGYKRVRLLFDNYTRRDSYAKVGLLGSEADERPDGDLTQAEIGAVHEFGSEDGKIPQRSWIGSTFDKQRDELLRMARELIGYVVDGKTSIEKALGILGLKLSTEIKKTVTTGHPIPPANADSTAKRKVELGTGKSYDDSINDLVKNQKKYTRLLGRITSGKTTDFHYEAFGIRTLVDTGRMIASVTWAVIVQGKK